MELLLPLLIPMAWYSPFVQIGSAIMQPLYWVVSGILVLAHGMFAPLFGARSGWTWSLSIVMLTVVIRTALIPLFVKQIKSSRQMQLLQPKVRELLMK
jgi:YidC/Oxa1 family membrane protein insertase